MPVLLILWLITALLMMTTDPVHGQQQSQDSLSMKQAVLSEHHKELQETLLEFSTTPLSGDDPDQASKAIVQRFIPSLQNRLSEILSRTRTQECRQLVAEHFGHFVQALALEKPLPFANAHYNNTCPEPIYDDFENLPEGMHIGHIQNRSYQPSDGVYIQDYNQLKILYGILAHHRPQETIRLIEALFVDTKRTQFVLHIDDKSDEMYQEMVAYAERRPHVHILNRRCRVNWGGFSMVNATLQILQYAFGLHHVNHALDFDKFVHLSASTYPLASNSKIRKVLSEYPLDANLFNVVMQPTRPHPAAWHYFVECDDWVHRIYRHRALNTWNGGIELYTASQWFVLSREFAHYLALAEPGTLVHDMVEYMRHVVVADETFFGTILRNTPFCTKHHNWNFVHLQFDAWESEQDISQRDPRKCIMADKDHCGRSPTILTKVYAPILELSGDLFARKFDESIDSDIKDYLDDLRSRQEAQLVSRVEPPKPGTDFEGHGALIVAKETVSPGHMPLCLGLGPTRNKVRLVPCFYDWVIPTLADGWETGAVIEDETLPHNRWRLGPCSSDGTLTRNSSTAELVMVRGNLTKTGPGCMITQLDGIRAGRCLDAESGLQEIPGGVTQVYPCAKRWHQFFSFGNGAGDIPKNAIHTSIPRHAVHRLRNLGHVDMEYYLCLGVRGRGEKDEKDWISEDEDEMLLPADVKNKSLHQWRDMQVVGTACSNGGAVLEWIYVPFIVEDTNSTNTTTTEEKANHKGGSRGGEL
jgi:hypothetical protein